MQRKEKRSKSIDAFEEKGMNRDDSFEKFYNKDLDLEEGKHFITV